MTIAVARALYDSVTAQLADEACGILLATNAQEEMTMATEKLTAETITDAQIRALESEAGVAGDLYVIHLCGLARAAHETAHSDGQDLIGPDGELVTPFPGAEVEARRIPEARVGVRVMSPDAEDEGAQGAIVEVSPLRDAVKVQWDEGQATWCMRDRLLSPASLG